MPRKPRQANLESRRIFVMNQFFKDKINGRVGKEEKWRETIS